MIKDFVYLKPTTREEALALLLQYKDECKVVAGGQSLLILMRQGLVTPKYLIDIKGLRELNYTKLDPKEGLKIGATTTHRAIEKSLVVKEKFSILAEMERKLASIQTRNWGTIGGNLCHGEPAGDPAPVLIALKGNLTLANSTRERRMAVEDFSLDYFETALTKDELLLEIQVPFPTARTATVFDKFTMIKNDMAIVSVAASVTLSDDGAVCKDVRVVLGGAASTPRRAARAEEILVGKKLDGALLEEVSQKVSEQAEPVSDIHASEEYRRELVKILTKRMVRKAWDQAKLLAG
jgi:carbon-monoxide dehydrogenase medium subunit